MKIKSLLLASLLAVIILSGCADTTPPTPSTYQKATATAVQKITSTPTPTPPPADEADPGLNLLLAVEGEVLLKRETWSDFHPTAFGAALKRGDLLKLSSGAQAKILCDTLNIWNAPSGAAPTGLSGCPRPEAPFLIRRGVKIASTRGGDPAAPYIISPRSTKLLNAAPTLRWNAPSGASSYIVQVRGGDVNWVQEGVVETELLYPGEPPLEPGASYLLVVEDDAGKSSRDEGSVGLGFSLLSEDEAAEIKKQREQIMALDLSDTARNFALAQYYASQGLIAEGIEILAEMIEAGSKEAAVHQSLANLYVEIGLFLLAEPRYVEALGLAEDEGDIERIADIQAGLGQIYLKLGNTDRAIERLTEAQASYERLGDASRVDEVVEWLAELKP